MNGQGVTEYKWSEFKLMGGLVEEWQHPMNFTRRAADGLKVSRFWWWVGVSWLKGQGVKGGQNSSWWVGWLRNSKTIRILPEEQQIN